MAKRKCAICGDYIENNEESVPYKKRYAHLKCFNVAMQVVSTKPRVKSENKKETTSKKSTQKEIKAGLSEEEYQEKKKLCDYLREKLKRDLSIKIYKLIDDYIKKYKVTYSDIYETLYWYYSIESNPIEGDMIGIFPYIYDKSKAELERIKNAQSVCENNISHISEMYPQKTIKAPDMKDRVIKQIDISKIGDDKV